MYLWYVFTFSNILFWVIFKICSGPAKNVVINWHMLLQNYSFHLYLLKEEGSYWCLSPRILFIAHFFLRNHFQHTKHVRKKMLLKRFLIFFYLLKTHVLLLCTKMLLSCWTDKNFSGASNITKFLLSTGSCRRYQTFYSIFIGTNNCCFFIIKIIIYIRIYIIVRVSHKNNIWNNY